MTDYRSESDYLALPDLTYVTLRDAITDTT